ncbi:hypothetical protein [Rubinisphaera sp.]|uniref:hypothetical protein n=1 Tax=Rubinisphaera sp. TaxID=2024857 RepID=UPI000C112351|nr:hypothetical protein [Rubinisphaera sp.]MBV10808.1 hypothetical protein [Rubinisphaera sp.]HCS52058.1 hypothetical protein [Planctomycetaceae bacterium]|tara:strand:- start:7868 stop:9859 length:1992 start_codon:yes stop_codon:yes gene_type:complete
MSNSESNFLNENQPLLPAAFHWEVFIVAILIALNAGLLIARLGSSSALGSANDRSRWCTIWSISARGTYQIDEIIQNPGWDSIDKVRHEGHFYSTKPPLYPTMLAGLYRVIHQITGWSLLTETETVSRLILLMVNMVPLWIALFFFWKLLLLYEFPGEVRTIIIAMLAFATPFLPFLTVLNNHTIAVVTLIFAIYPAVKIQKAHANQELLSNRNLALLYMTAGFFAAFTCCNELPAGLFGIAIFLVLCKVDCKRTWIWFVPAALVPLIAFFVTNIIVTGGWKPFYLYYGTEKYVYEHLGIPSYWAEPRGVDRARDTVPQYLFHCLIGHHGIFSLTPIFLLAIPGFIRGLRSKISWQRIWHLIGLILTLAILAFYWKRTENYNYGGVSVALRWTLWLTPFWMLAIAEAISCCSIRKGMSVCLLVLTLPSIYSAWGPWNTPWQQPWLFNVMSAQGWIDYSDPPPKIEQPVHSWLIALPDSTEVDVDYWVEFITGESTVLRIADAGPSEFEGQTARKINIVEKDHQDRPLRSRELTVNTQKVLAGEDPDQFLMDWTDSKAGAIRNDQVVFLRGIPISRTYHRNFDRYVFIPVRDEAFRCLRLAANVWDPQAIPEKSRVERADLWLSEEVPFGLVKMLQSVSSSPGRDLVSRKSWRAVKFKVVESTP